MKRFFAFIKYFLYITTCVLIVCATNVQLSGSDTIPANMLWQILLSGFLTTLATVFAGPVEFDIKQTSIIKIIIHYIILCVMMIICGNLFGWLNIDLQGITMMLVSVAVVYLLVYFSGYWIDKKQADEINEKLKEKYRDKE